jgi:hypothetical protein
LGRDAEISALLKPRNRIFKNNSISRQGRSVDLLRQGEEQDRHRVQIHPFAHYKRNQQVGFHLLHKQKEQRARILPRPWKFHKNQFAAIFRLLLNMNLFFKLSVAPILFLPLIAAWAGTPEEAKVVEKPSVNTTEPWQISVGGPGWLAGVSGHTGFRGVSPYVNVGVKQILDHVNAIASLSGEVRRGRFGALGDFLYLNGQAGSPESSGLVSKLDLGFQQFIGEFFGSYRVIEGPRGWLDLLAGFRYIYLGEQVGLQANNMAIEAASTKLVDQFAQQLATPGSDLRTLIERNIVDQLTALDGRNPKLPVGPIAGDQKGMIADLVQRLIEGKEQELAAAIRAGAQARVNQLKAQLSNQVANSVASRLNRSFSFYDNWTDPVIGLRGRFNLSKAFYLTAESDVGGFGIGSDIAVQAYAALGCQITRIIYAEAGYRYLYEDFRDESANDFLYQLALHGAQVTVGIIF